MAEHIHTTVLILVIATVTALLRYLPFLVLRKNAEAPPFISYIGKVLPYAVMGMLVVYCLSEVNFGELSSILPNLIAVLLTGLLQFWRHSILLSIAGGTACYMLLIQCVF